MAASAASTHPMNAAPPQQDATAWANFLANHKELALALEQAGWPTSAVPSNNTATAPQTPTTTTNNQTSTSPLASDSGVELTLDQLGARQAELASASASHFPLPPKATPPFAGSTRSPMPTATSSLHFLPLPGNPFRPAPVLPALTTASPTSLSREPVPSFSSEASAASSFSSVRSASPANGATSNPQVSLEHLTSLLGLKPALSPQPVTEPAFPITSGSLSGTNAAAAVAPASPLFTPIGITLPRMPGIAVPPQTAITHSEPVPVPMAAPTAVVVVPPSPNAHPSSIETIPSAAHPILPRNPTKSPSELENEYMWELYYYMEKKGKELEAMSPVPSGFAPPTANNAAYQSLVQLLRSEITELHARFDPKITQLESHLTSTPPNPPTYFYASRLRERLSKAVQDCTNAIRIYEEMIQSAYRAQANIMAIQQDANNYTTNTIREVNANRQRAFEVGNQKWSNVFNYGDEAPWVCEVCGGRFIRYGQPHVCRW